jgi:ribosomal subunit interface protein
MNIRFTARHFKATDEIRRHALSSIERLAKFDDRISSTEVVLIQEEKPTRLVCTCEFIVKVTGTVIATTATAPRHVESIDKSTSKIVRLLEKHKEKRDRERVRKSKLAGRHS